MELSRLVAFNVCERKRLREIEIDGLEFIFIFLSSEVCKRSYLSLCRFHSSAQRSV